MQSVGVDPGVNFGVTWITGPNVVVMYGRLPKKTNPGEYGIEAMNMIIRLISTGEKRRAIVEGAAYAKPYGQVKLEEVRQGFFTGLSLLKHKVEILPPATIRKIAFGNGRKSAQDIWPTMNSNAADSIGCALAALHKYEETS